MSHTHPLPATTSHRHEPATSSHHHNTPAHHPHPTAVPEATDAPAIDGSSVFTLLMPELQRAVADEGYTTPTPIQVQSIPHLLKGRDLLGIAQTGTGKTAAFALPLLQYLTQHPRPPARGKPRALILGPTRELVAQIGDSIRTYGRHVRVSHTTIFGGVGQHPQVQALQRGVDILVATPGRLLDLMQQRHLTLDQIEVFVLDEADRMLDMGFIRDIRRVIAQLPKKRHSLFFSATMAKEIIDLSHSMTLNPVQVSVTPEQPTVERIVQKVMFVEKKDKDALLASLLRDPAINKVLVFTQMKHVANNVVKKLSASGIPSAAIHGNKSQSARTQVMKDFRSDRLRVLVATDIAARGIDVDGITHVINYELPNTPETYVHRIGRTARAGCDGDAISFCCAQERDYLRSIERLIRKNVPQDRSHPYHSDAAQNATGEASRPPPRAQRGQQQQRHRGSGGGQRDHQGQSGNSSPRGGQHGTRSFRARRTGRAA